MSQTKWIKRIILAGVFFAGRGMLGAKDLKDQLVQSAHGQTLKSVAVMNFKAIRTDQEMGAAVSEVLRGMLASVPQKEYRFIEREQLNSVMKEQSFGLTGAVSQDQAVQIGKLLAAQYVVVGSVSKLGNLYALNGRLINTQTSEIEHGGEITANTEEEMALKIKTLAYALVGLQVPESAASAQQSSGSSGGFLNDAGFRGGRFKMWYTDGLGKHTGGDLELKVNADQITGIDYEDTRTYDITGSVIGDRIVGYYYGRAGAGHGNFEFKILEDGKRLAGKYYQVTNGANGVWAGELVEKSLTE